MQISEAAGGVPAAGTEPCRFPKLEECAHFHYERVQLPQLTVTLQTSMDQSLHSQHTNEDDTTEWHMVQVTSGDECWLLQRNYDNFKMLDEQLHQCIYDRKISQLPDLSSQPSIGEDIEAKLIGYLERFCKIADNSLNCGPILNWLQMDNRGHRLLVPSEESRSINTPAVAAAYSVRRYVSQARDELNLEVGDMISVIDMASPGESMWWRGKRGFQVGFFPQHCVHIIGDKVPRNIPLPPPVVGSLALSPIKPVLRKHGKLIAFFRSFILNRPSRRRLKQSGILKERVFGCDLGEHLLNSGNEIPMVLKCCAEFIETHGIVDGIYRLSGITSNIQKLRNAFDEDRIPNLYTEDILQDIHSVASLLKMYFRELPNPLCTYQLYQSFVNAVQGCNTTTRNSENDHERLLKMREAVQKLPPPHYRTLEYLMRHLARVAKHGANTGMTTRNLAIVWAPNLLRCAELEVGGVAALQGVGVQAVVTEFLICYTDLIFCDHLPNLDNEFFESESLSPKKCRPKSLAISTPTKLITLEEARSKHHLNRSEECNYIEVGGGPSNLPKKYHTVIELPAGARKRLTKRSPIGWRSFFTKSRNTSQGSLMKNRKASTPGIVIPEKSVTESDLTDMKRKLRSVKSAESLTSGHSEPAANEVDVLGPLHTLNKPSGHNRSVSHDSYFDTLQNSQNNSEGSLLDLSEIQLNFELEESEMRIFSEDESLVSSPRMQKDMTHRRILTRARPEEFSSTTNSGNPSPKKQARVVISPDSLSRKRTRLEDQLSDIQYIDCSTPDNTCTISTTAVVHSLPETTREESQPDSYQPKNKSPRNSEIEIKRQSLNLETASKAPTTIPKSLTEMDINGKVFLGKSSTFATPTLQSPTYKQLNDSSSSTTPAATPDLSPLTEIGYEKLVKMDDDKKPSPTYENILTTISITYKSPTRSINGNHNADSIYEDVFNVEKAVVPTSVASLPIQEASQPTFLEERPKSMGAIEDSNQKDNGAKINFVSDPTSVGNLNSKTEIEEANSNRNSSVDLNLSQSPFRDLSPSDLSLSEVMDNLSTSHTSLSFPASPSRNSISPIMSPTQQCENTASPLEANVCSSGSSFIEDARLLRSQDDLSSYDANETGFEMNDKPTYNYGENIAPENNTMKRPESFNLIDFSPNEPEEMVCMSVNDKRKSSESESLDDSAIYQQVKYFRRSIHEINALLELDKTKSDNTDENKDNKMDTVDVSKIEGSIENDVEQHYDSLEPENVHVYENVDVPSEKPTNVYENVEVKNEEKVEVEVSKPVEVESMPVMEKIMKFEEIQRARNNSESNNSKKVYDKDCLPPCLRARNLKNSIKTRSLDEDEFKKEFGLKADLERRKSMDDNVGYKMNTLPKVLNQPKVLPLNDEKVNSIHLAHSQENVSGVTSSEQLRRERIEKYKEERRKFLQDKYRTESFKEDKDVLLSRLKVFKSKDEKLENENSSFKSRVDDPISLSTRRRKNSKNEECEAGSSDYAADSLDEDSSKTKAKHKTKEQLSKESLKSKAAIFETQANNKSNQRTNFRTTDNKKVQDRVVYDRKNSLINEREAECDFIRSRKRDDDIIKSERRRHTYESRERETEAERNRRLSLENKSPRKEKTSPSYCIKDMKAIFESKSKQ